MTGLSPLGRACGSRGPGGAQCRHLWVDSNVEEGTLNKEGKESRPGVPRCFGHYSAVVYSSSKVAMCSRGPPDAEGVARKAWPGRGCLP